MVCAMNKTTEKKEEKERQQQQEEEEHKCQNILNLIIRPRRRFVEEEEKMGKRQSVVSLAITLFNCSLAEQSVTEEKKESDEEECDRF